MGKFIYIDSAPSGFAFGNALEFDGVNDYTETAVNFSVTGGFIISFWAKTQTALDVGQWWFSERGSNDLIFFYETTVYLRCTGSSNQNVWNYDYRTNNGAWTHYAFTRDGSGDINFYVNGVVQTKSTSNINTSTLSFRRFGARQSDTKHLNGVLDELGIKGSYVPSGTDVTDLYNGGLGADFSDVISTPDIHIQFNESSGSTAADSSANSRDLTLYNFSGTYFIPH